jgi:signal transduction histidine kinase
MASPLGPATTVVATVATLLVAYGLVRRGRSRSVLVALAETAEAAWADQAPAGATLRVDLDRDLAVSADPAKLEAMLAELFGNAVAYGGRDVTVQLRRHDDGFVVADDGRGPDADADAGSGA